jgi:hypothetical protein
MDDFYIYYVIDEETPTTGQIQAVAPHVIDMGDMSFIRVPADYGLQFTVGKVPMANWVVQYDDESEDMILTKITATAGTPFTPVFSKIPDTQENPEMVITFREKDKCFHVQVPAKGLRKPKRRLHFFVTPVDDPNMSYFQFPVDFSVASTPEGHVISCPAALPKKFSIFTNKVLDRYQMRIVK